MFSPSRFLRVCEARHDRYLCVGNLIFFLLTESAGEGMTWQACIGMAGKVVTGGGRVFSADKLRNPQEGLADTAIHDKIFLG